MPKRAATLKDVAEAVGVHVSTVSRALDARTRSLIRHELAERILSTATTLGYRPNHVAHSLRTRRSRIVGVLVPDLTNPIFPPIVRGIDDVFLPRGYAAMVVNTDGSLAKAAHYASMLRGRGVDGLVVASAELTDHVIAAAIEEGLPVVAANRVADHPGLSAVVSDDAAGIVAAIEHLVALGHRCIAHIAGPQLSSTGAARAKAFRQRLGQLGLANEHVIEAQRFSESDGKRCANAILTGTVPVTAIVAANDLIALGALSAVQERGLKCPDDISIVGFNDMPMVDRITPALTTIRVDTYETGRRAAALVLEQIEAPVAPSRVVETLPVELIVRASTGPARKAAGKRTSRAVSATRR